MIRIREVFAGRTISTTGDTSPSRKTATARDSERPLIAYARTAVRPRGMADVESISIYRSSVHTTVCKTKDREGTRLHDVNSIACSVLFSAEGLS